MSKGRIFLIVKIFAVIGLNLSSYLLWQQFFRPAFQPCNINSFINCDAIVSGPVAKTFGISTPLYGFIGYIIILFAVFTRRIRLLLFMATFGLIFCLWLAYIELFVLKVICPICIGCQLVIASIFSLAVMINRNKDVKNQ